MAEILVLTHTNPEFDSRIAKYLSFYKENSLKYIAIGVKTEKRIQSPTNSILVYPKIKSTIDIINKLRVGTRYSRILLRFVYYSEIAMKQILHGLMIRPKVVHVHDWFSLPSGWLICKIFNARLIYDAHELESEANGVSREMSILARSIEKICWSKIDTFITVSESILAWYMIEYGIKKSEIILNAPIVEKVSTEDYAQEDYLRKKLKIDLESRIFLYIGVLEYGRGIEKYLETFNRVDVADHLVFLGSGSLEGKVRESMKHNPRIHIHNLVPHEQVTQIAKNANFGLCLIEEVSLSDWLCLPNKFFEYTFANLPMVVSNFPELSEFVTRYSLGIAIETSGSELTDLVKDAEKLEKLEGGAHEADLYELSWEYQKIKLKSIYG